MDEYAACFADVIDVVVPKWVERSVLDVAEREGVAVTDELRAAASSAGVEAKIDVSVKVRALLATDIDEQSTTPLALIRSAAAYPTAVLRHFGVPPVKRDDFVRSRFPEDIYDLTPTNLTDVDETLVEPGLAWGASKAFQHKARHRK